MRLETGADFLWGLTAFACFALLNLLLVAGIVGLSGGRPLTITLEEAVTAFGLQYVVLCALAFLLVVLSDISIWHVLLAAIPLAMVHASFRSYLRLETETRRTFERISQLLDERDPYTATHSKSVAELSADVAREMGLSQKTLDKAEIAARVHDIGKIAVPDAILLKQGSLTSEEWEKMKEHPVISSELIEELEMYAPVVDAVRHEHERWDGSGYPDGLSGEEIPLMSRVILVADVYDALTTDRPYRKAFAHSEALEIIQESRGRDLDPQVVDALLRMFARREE